jgi:hypothetical protein
MKFFERLGGGKTQSAEQSAEQEAFNRRAALRRGGPEADQIRREDKERAVAEANQEDAERNAKFLEEWPRERARQQKMIEETERQIVEYARKEKETDVSWRKNEDKQFEKQSRTGDSPYDEQRRGLRELRNLRDIDAKNLEAYREEQKTLEQNLAKMKDALASGDKRFEALQS